MIDQENLVARQMLIFNFHNLMANRFSEHNENGDFEEAEGYTMYSEKLKS